MEMEMEMEFPECPICLQVYRTSEEDDDDEEEEESVIPRVLSCGHSACETCLSLLPERHPDTIRCPSCNQLVPFPKSQGPSALPKNIDLLSFINQQRNPNKKNLHSTSSSSSHPKHQNLQNPQNQHDSVPGLWSEGFYSSWKDWVLPMDCISMEKNHTSGGNGFISLFEAKLVNSSSSLTTYGRCCFSVNQGVTLLRVAYSTSYCNGSRRFSPSYTVRIMEALYRLSEEVRAELRLVLTASCRQSRVCTVYGLWMDSGDGSVFIVSERFYDDFYEKFNSLQKGVDLGDGKIGLAEGNKEHILYRNGGIHGFAMVGIGLCEALVGLHSEGLICGCLAMSCFGYDSFGRFFVDPNEIIMMGRRVRRCIADMESAASSSQTSDELEVEALITNLMKMQIFVSPELLFRMFHGKETTPDCGSFEYVVGYGSDIWSLAFILVILLVGDTCTECLVGDLCHVISRWSKDSCDEGLLMYKVWLEKVTGMLGSLLGTEFASLHQVLCRALDFDLATRPCITDVLRCIRELLIQPHLDILVRLDNVETEKNTVHCLTLGDLCHPQNEIDKDSVRVEGHEFKGSKYGEEDHDDVNKLISEGDLVDGLCVGKFESINLQGHLDCITGLAVGGGFLFSSSFDKTVRMWSLQNFSHLQSFKGHEHRVMAVVFVDADKQLCISGDSGGGIFVWEIDTPIGHEPSRIWYEPKDWRYSGIHALAAAGVEYLYTGSGDKSIKAWSLQDYTLKCTMNGHKSVVSSLVVGDGVLYSGSWDGTIRLWSLNDHSPLTVLGEETPGKLASVLSLSVDHDMLVAGHENGYIKMWRNDVLSASTQKHNDAVLAIVMKGKWLFEGGWNRTVNVQELSGDQFHIDTHPIGSIACDSVVTTLLYCDGKLLVGFADKTIKIEECNELNTQKGIATPTHATRPDKRSWSCKQEA